MNRSNDDDDDLVELFDVHLKKNGINIKRFIGNYFISFFHFVFFRFNDFFDFFKMFFNVGLSVPVVSNAYMTMCSCFGYPLQQRCCRHCYQMNLAVVPAPAIVPVPAVMPAIIPTATSISIMSSRVCVPPAPVVAAQRPCSSSYRRSSVCSKRR